MTSQDKITPLELSCGQTPTAQGLTTPIISYVGEKSSIVSVIPDSIYHFKRKPGTTRFLLESREGEAVQNFPSTYKQGADKGLEYIGFRKMTDFHLKKWNYCLELANARMFTGTNLKTCGDGNGRGFGDDRSIGRRDCVLIALSADGQYLDIAFVFGKADKAEEVFEAWIDDYIRGRLNVEGTE